MANSLLSQIENMINSSILSFNMKVAKKYNIDISELNEMWSNGGACDTQPPLCDSDTQPFETDTKPEPIKVPISRPNQLTKSQSFSQPNTPQLQLTKSQTITSSAPKKTSPSQEKTCPYSFSRGPNSGSVCGTKIKGEGNYCSKHKQYENKEQKGPKKVLPQPKKSPVSSDDDDEEQRIREELNKKKTEGFTDKEISYMFFKKPELGENLSFHKQTGFVCNEKRLIVGKKTDDNKVVPLTEEDKKVAKSWNFNVKQPETETESKSEAPKIVKIVKPPVITKVIETKAQESKAQESKAQETKAQETKAQTDTVSRTPKKFTVPVAKLMTTKIEKSRLAVKENPEVIEKKSNQSLNEEAKNTKKTISTIIEQQKDIEDILSDLTKGEEEIDEVEGSIQGSDEEDCADDIEEEDEILEDD